MTPFRSLGRKGPKVSAIGIGCWQFGGMAPREKERLHGWYGADDDISIRVVHRALDLGVTLFDTADMYGVGRSERLLGRALAGKRQSVVIATKFGKTFDEAANLRTDHHDERPEYIRAACEASLRRLGTDHIDLYQLHDGRMPLEKVDDVLNTLEGLVAAGKIGGYGWSTDETDRAEAFLKGPNCIAVQQKLNVMEGNRAILAIAERHGLASINRSPLGQGLLTGRITPQSTFETFDVREHWDLRSGKRAQHLAALERIRAHLTSDGRTLAQGALGWLLAVSPVTIPIPGCRTIAQVEENCGALAKGPLSASSMAAIDKELAALDVAAA